MSNNHQKLSNNNLNNFRILVRKALMLEKNEESLFYAIPETVWDKIFSTNFNSELTYAQKVILGNIEPIIHSETKKLERIKSNIDNFDYSSKLLKDYIDNDKKIIFITDNDNDGSVSQAIIYQLTKVLPENKKKNVLIEYARAVNGNNSRGFTYDLVEHIAKNEGLSKDSDFLVITADNGINSRPEQLKINQEFPNVKLLITDHHNPEPDSMIIENENTIIFNPHYFALEHTNEEILNARGIKFNKDKKECYDFFNEYNISGATTVGLLIKNYIQSLQNLDNMSLIEQLELFKSGNLPFQSELKVIDELSRISNMIDYVKTAPADKPYHFNEIKNGLRLQSLLNVNNSISNIITGDIDSLAIEQLKERQISTESDFDYQLIIDEINKIKALNDSAHHLLSQYKNYLSLTEDKKQILDKTSNKENLALNAIANSIINGDKSSLVELDNHNYIEQLRPYIFELTSNDNKSLYEKNLLDAMVDLYEKIQISERRMIFELRKIELMNTYELENSTISVLDPSLQKIFNRKLMNKAYNRAGVGFNLTLDNIKEHTISGSFRSTYKISDILDKKSKSELEKQLKIKIDILGHDMAAGFIVNSKSKINLDIIPKINEFINNRIEKLSHSNNTHKYEIELATNLESIDVINKINTVIRGNVAHFTKISPLVKLNDINMVHVDSKTNTQTLLSEKVKQQKYGWVSLQTKLPSKYHSQESVIIPNGLLAKIVEQNYEPYLKLNFMNDGAFIGEKIVHPNEVKNIITIEYDDKRKQSLVEYFEEQKELLNKNGNGIVKLTRDDIKNNPFFIFNQFSDDDFDKFEQVIIKIIETNNVDCYSVLDVEADGFGNARLLNIGTNNYFIDDENYELKLSSSDFKKQLFKSIADREYLINEIQLKNYIDSGEIVKINRDEFFDKKSLLTLTNNGEHYLFKNRAIFDQITEVKNYKYVDDDVIVNRKLKAETFSYLIKPEDFIIPITISNLTGITQELADQYGLSIGKVDDLMTDYFKDKSTLFIAHNTSYDGRICRANLAKFSNILTDFSNLIADSAEFSKIYQLMYDNIEIVKFENIPGLSNYYFYNHNEFSDLSFESFVKSTEEGEYPDVKNQIRIVKVKDDNLDGSFSFYIKDIKTNILNKINTSYFSTDENDNQRLEKYSLQELFDNKDDENRNNLKIPLITTKGLNLNDIGYKAQGLGETKFIRQLLLDNEDFSVEIIDDYSKYPLLEKYEHLMEDLQHNYRFNKSISQNLHDFLDLYDNSLISNDPYNFNIQLKEFVKDFVELNKEIENKYSNTWFHKSVLSTFEPKLYTDLNKTTFEIISTLTGIPEHLVEEVLHKSYDFQQKYKKDGCTGVITNEEHMNGPYKGPIVGDIAYEDKATILLLADRFTNKFSNDIKFIANLFNHSQKNFALKFLKQEFQSENASFDSMSFKQHRHYLKRDTLTKTIQQLQTIDNEVLSNEQSVIKFKLSSDYLQDGKHVYAVKKDGVKLSLEQIEEDAKKLAFIIGCIQIGISSKNNIKSIFDDNIEKMLDYKEDLMQHYVYIEQNNSVEMITGYTKKINDYLFKDLDFSKLASDNSINPPLRKNAKTGLDYVEQVDLKSIETILLHQLFQNIRGIETENNGLKDDIITISQNSKLNINEQNNSIPFKTQLGKQINTFISVLNSLQYYDNEDVMENFNNKYPSGISESDNFVKITNTFMDNILSTKEFKQLDVAESEKIAENVHRISKVLLLNSFAIQYKNYNPTRIQKVLHDIDNAIDYPDDLNVECKMFLDAEHSRISRLNAQSHLLNNMNYADFIPTIHTLKDVNPVLDLEKEIKKSSLKPK